jgi:polar amino acid transport system substrate-binding protein
MRASDLRDHAGTRVSLGLLAVAGLLVAVGCGGGDFGGASGTFEPNRPGTLTVMTQPLPTVGFWEGQGERPDGGFEYALARELADRLGLERVVVHTEQFSRIIAGELGDADIAMALITPTPEREEVLDFSSPYIEAAPTLLVRAGTEVADVQTAQEMTWALGANTTFQGIVADQIRPDANPLVFEERTEEVEAVKSGRADVAMFDLPAAAAIVHTEPGLAMAAKLSQTEPIAVALPKGSHDLEAVSAAVRGMLADGTVDELSEEWLGTSLTDLENSVPLLRTAE